MGLHLGETEVQTNFRQWKKKLSESSSQAKMQGSSLRDRCVIERGQHEATMKRYELQDARLETVCSSGLSLRSGAKLQFRKCLLFPEGGASKRPRGSPEGKYNCCMIRPRPWPSAKCQAAPLISARSRRQGLGRRREERTCNIVGLKWLQIFISDLHPPSSPTRRIHT